MDREQKEVARAEKQRRKRRRSRMKKKRSSKKSHLKEMENKIEKMSSTTNYNDNLHQLKWLLELWCLAIEIKTEICVKSNENTSGNIHLSNSLSLSPTLSVSRHPTKCFATTWQWLWFSVNLNIALHLFYAEFSNAYNYNCCKYVRNVSSQKQKKKKAKKKGSGMKN